MVSRRLFLLSLLVLLFLGGCAAPERPRVLFPPPPEEPRMEFIGVFASQNDFPKTGMQAFLERSFGAPPKAAFQGPMGIVSDGAGTVYVSDVFDRNIRKYDMNARTVDYLFKAPIFGTPLDLAMDGDGRLFVADGEKGIIFVIDPEKARGLFTIGSPDVVTKPSYLAVNERLGRLYVSDAKGRRVVVFDLDGRHLFSFGEGGYDEGQFHTPQGLAIASDDRVFVVDQVNANIQVFDADGNFLYRFGERGDQPHQFEAPADVAFDSDGNLHVVDRRKAFVAAYTPEGRLLLATGGAEPTHHALGFSTPQMICIDDTDRMFITDFLNRRFSVWQYMSEAYLEKHPVTDEDVRRIQELLGESGG